MNINVNNIFREKLNNIQARVPVRVSQNKPSVSFQEMLDTAKIGTTKYHKQNASDESFMPYIERAVSSAANKYDIPKHIIKAVISAESGFNPRAISSKGAQGLMQLMPTTAKSLGVNNPMDISQNIDGGTKYLKEQLNRFNGNLSLALSAYNAGPNSVLKHGGIPPYQETQGYVDKVLNYIEEYNKTR